MTWRTKELVEQRMQEDDETTGHPAASDALEQNIVILSSGVEQILDGPSGAAHTASSSGTRTKRSTYTGIWRKSLSFLQMKQLCNWKTIADFAVTRKVKDQSQS